MEPVFILNKLLILEAAMHPNTRISTLIKAYC
jgi:hypothetical protein